MKGKVAALAGMISALLLALGLVIVAGWTSDGLTLHYLDVGKCNCVLAESPDGSFMMIDAGSNGEKDTRRILEYLKAQGVETLEYLLITHPHKDHIRAAEAVLRACPAKTVLMGDFGKDTVGSDVFESLLSFLQKSGQRISTPEPGDVYSLGEKAFFTILIQDDSVRTAEEELNDCSTGLILEDAMHRFLFYGDGEEKAEEALQDSGYDLRCDVLMVAHHGNKGSTKKKLLEAVRPRIAVISCGVDDEGQLREPSEKVLERLEEAGASVYRTDRDHTVIVSSGRDGLTVQTEAGARENSKAD